MRALICRQWGSVNQLEVDELPMPQPGPEQVLIDVAATAVNYADAIMVSGNYQTKPSLPFAPGLETAGTVVACGKAVTRCAVGDRVMALLHYGGMAEFALADQSDIWRLPAAMKLRDAAAFPVAYFSSDVALRWAGRLGAGETLLVLGAAGGVGLTAVEIGRAMGARVIAGASSAEKRAIALEHGADEVIDYTVEGWSAAIKDLTGGRGVDVCFDPIGGDLFDPALSALGWGGRYVLVGFVGGIPQIPANRLLVKNRAALGSALRYYRWHAPEKLEQSVAALFDWYAQGRLQPLVTHQLPLERGAEALQLLTERRAHGRVLVLPEGPLQG